MKNANITSSTTIYQVFHSQNAKANFQKSSYNKGFNPEKTGMNPHKEFVPYLNERDGMNRLIIRKESPRSVPMSPVTSDMFRRTNSFRKTENIPEGRVIDWGSFKFVPTVIHCPSKVSLRKIISLANMPNSEKIHNSPAFLSTHRKQKSQEFAPPVGSYQVEEFIIRPKTREPTFPRTSRAEIQNPSITKNIDYYNTLPSALSKSQAIMEFNKQTDRSNNFLSKQQWNLFVPKTKTVLGYEFDNLPHRKEMLQKDMKRVELSSKMTPKILPKHLPVNQRGMEDAYKQHKKKYAVHVAKTLETQS